MSGDEGAGVVGLGRRNNDDGADALPFTKGGLAVGSTKRRGWNSDGGDSNGAGGSKVPSPSPNVSTARRQGGSVELQVVTALSRE